MVNDYRFLAACIDQVRRADGGACCQHSQYRFV
jgi:hypothetical protein